MSNKKKYRKLFEAGNSDSPKLKAAFEQVSDIRKFEIELYWKRATYFWALIAVAFAGYFAVLGAEFIDHKYFLSMVIASIGIVFTYAWHLANRGSKYWQENWENHMDFLEDEITGPLYKTLLERPDLDTFVERHILGPKSISVSKINQWVSVYVLASWFVLQLFSTYKSLMPYELCDNKVIVTVHIVIWVMTFVGMYLVCGKADTHKEKQTPNMRSRKVGINDRI
ncbi:TPA: hypothetical protein ACN359_004603 [Vibrio parahaemolyticus]